ncbi:MAG TPA: tRNA (N6-threonylcarbamoyladenosine(37)-N6)-methyltransferase TrmO [Anaerolineae bacterium]|nr:tRNA (N6-threonylcarbamoyladenosine(37)-N6)-methyltransferase TrmO [Anaerolineae bacterium]
MKKTVREAEIRLRPIGVVRNEVPGPEPARWEDLVSEIVIDEELAEALKGIEGFSHLIVLFWMGKFEREVPPPLKVHPESRKELPLVGVFATRSPVRPNPIGLTTVELLGRRGNVLKVKGLDAFDDTPVLDIKPYLERGDRIENPAMPEWLLRLWGE